MREPNPLACPACGTKGKPVGAVTLRLLLTDEARSRWKEGEGDRFCAESGCDVVYYHPENGDRFLQSDVRVRVGQKVFDPPHPVCYCFDHSAEAIEEEVRRTATSRIPDDITDKCRQGLDRCEETNPQGSCCLGNVRKALKEAQMKHAKGTGSGKDGTIASGGEIPDCCREDASPPEAAPHRRRNVGLWATTAAVFSAIASSACCWLPLLLIAFGASAVGVAGFLEAYRFHLLGATGLLLGVGFYLVYFRREACGPGEACAVPNPKLKRFNKTMLWGATVVALLFALFPNYVGALLGSGGEGDDPPTALSPGRREVVLAVTGMT